MPKQSGAETLAMRNKIYMTVQESVIGAGTGNYNKLQNIPVVNLVGSSEEKYVNLSGLNQGHYTLNGYYRLTPNSDILQIESPVDVSVLIEVGTDEDGNEVTTKVVSYQYVSDGKVYIKFITYENGEFSEEKDVCLSDITANAGSGSGASGGKVSLEEDGEGTLKKYHLFQDGEKVGTIDIPKSVTPISGELVKNPEDPENPGTYLSGTYLKLTVQDEDPVFVDVADFIKYNSVSSTDEIILEDDDHVISARIGKIDASKIEFSAADEGKGIAAKSVKDEIEDIKSKLGSGTGGTSSGLVWEED